MTAIHLLRAAAITLGLDQLALSKKDYDMVDGKHCTGFSIVVVLSFLPEKRPIVQSMPMTQSGPADFGVSKDLPRW